MKWSDALAKDAAAILKAFERDGADLAGLAARMAGVLEEAGAPVARVELEPGVEAITCRLEGTEPDGLLLAAHHGSDAERPLERVHLATSLAVLRALARERPKLARGLALVVSVGAQPWRGFALLAERRPELAKARWGLCASGGELALAGRKLPFAPFAHKGRARLRLTTERLGAQPHDEPVLRLARALLRLGNQQLPVHLTDAGRGSLAEWGRRLGLAGRGMAWSLRRSGISEIVLGSLVSDVALRRLADTWLRDSVVPVQVLGSERRAEAVLEGRLLPGRTAMQLLTEVRDVVDDRDVSFEMLEEVAGTTASSRSALRDALAQGLGGDVLGGLSEDWAEAAPLARSGLELHGIGAAYVPRAGSSPTERGTRVLLGLVEQLCG